MKIRCCAAYGCQETDSVDKKDDFWKYLDEEVGEATKTGAGLVIQMDGNLWAGSHIIPNDPRPQNRNGKLFEQFLTRNSHLTVVNSLDVCEGLITRSRFRSGKLEESVLDFFVVCHLVLPHISRMVIDEEGKYVLTNYQQVINGGKAANSDHATQYIDMDLKVITEKPKRCEIWNFKSKEAQDNFKISTSETEDFFACFNNNYPLLKQIENWRKTLKLHMNKSFKKIRINKKKYVKPLPPMLSKLINERNKLLKENHSEKEIEALDENISNLEAEINHNLIKEHFEKYKEDPEKVNLQQVWKTMGKLWPKAGTSLPTAKKNHAGKLVSEPKELKKLLAKEYKQRLRVRPVRPDFEQLEIRKERIFNMKLKLAEANSSILWTLGDLEDALRDIKKISQGIMMAW